MNARLPVIEIRDLVKGAGGPAPLRVRELVVDASDRTVVGGIDRPTAELLVHLITGAAVPDEGSVRVAGVDTRSIATDKEWLNSLDRFGLVSDRAVLLDSLPVAANLALPLTLAIEPMEPETRRDVDRLAREVALDAGALDRPMSSLSPFDRLRVHLARALANGPDLLLLEDPTAGLRDPAASAAFGELLRDVSAARPVGWLGFSNDVAFTQASAGVAVSLDVHTGVVKRPRRWWPWGRTSSRG